MSRLHVRQNLTCLLACISLLGGCDGAASPPKDVREALLASATKSEPEFPDGRDLLLTHFSYVGKLATSQGEAIYVADQRAVIAGMPAPRGQSFIVFFDRQFRYLGKIGYVRSRPLWCKGGCLYLYGDLDGFPQPGQKFPPGGNVIDVTDGYKNLKSYHAYAYGSSGGIDD
jgi:hypothetical protein